MEGFSFIQLLGEGRFSPRSTRKDDEFPKEAGQISHEAEAAGAGRTDSRIRVTDWNTALVGMDVEIRCEDRTVCHGRVDAVTPSGDVLWIQPLSAERRLYEKSETYEVWADTGPWPFLDDPS